MIWVQTLIFLSASVYAFPFTIVGTANRSGELEPCGCQVNQIGGLNRMAEWLGRERKNQEVLVMDSGDTFFSSPVISEQRKPMEKLRALTIAQAHKEMGVQAMTPGERDLSLGIGFLRVLGERSGIPFVVSNVSSDLGERFLKSYIIKTQNGSVGIIGLVSQEVFGEMVSVTDPEETLINLLKIFERQGIKNIVVLSHLGLQKDRLLISKFKKITVLGSHSLDPIVEKNETTESVLVQPQHEGQQLAIIKEGVGKLVDLGKELDKENSVAQLVRHYHEVRGTIKEGERISPVVATTLKPYVANPISCKTCHEEQYQFWEGTPHSSAMLVLYAKRQHLNSDCIGCHSLGYRKPGGFQSAKLSGPMNLLGKIFEGEPEGALDSRIESERYKRLHKKYHATIQEAAQLKQFKKLYWGVQCEHCHGNRNGHPGKTTTQKRVSAQTCVGCHRPPNAPDFDISMVQKVACPPIKRN